MYARDILQVAEALGLELEKSQEEYRCICGHPGHHDSVPSLYINPRKQVWICYGCSRGGSVYGLVRWMRPEWSMKECMDFVLEEATEAEVVMYRLSQQLKGWKEDEVGPYLLGALLAKHSGRPPGEVPREVLDVLYDEDPESRVRELFETEAVT